MIVTLTGPSCAGKSTLEKLLVAKGFSNAISTTTRQPRAGDVEGEAYYFVTRENFEFGLALDEFVEHVEFGGNYYGLTVQEVRRLERLGKPIVVVCEPVGQKQIAAWCKDNGYPCFAVFVDNPELVICNRFMLRAADDLIDTHLGYPDKVDAGIASYARRMKEMMTTERAWVGEAWASDIYNLRLSEFNETNQDEVVEIITGVAQKAPHST